MDKQTRKALLIALKALEDRQQDLFEMGHTFWHCDAQDDDHKKPFYYYQINRSVGMSTCSTCYKLMENRRAIRKVQKLLGLPLLPFTSNYKVDKHVQNMSVSNASMFNPNYDYLKS